MKDQYADNYRILGIPPGASWMQVRRAYKSLVNTWHPDRYQQDNHQRKLAEEKTKEITQSFKELADYYKQYGVLPIAAESAEVPVPEDFASQRKPDAPIEPKNHDTTEPTGTVTPNHGQKTSRSTLVTRTIVAASLASIAYFAWQFASSENNDNPPAMEERAAQALDAQNGDSFNLHDVSDKQFTIGSSLGEVYAIQGVPSKAENDIWFYGNSKVYFINGKVLRWEESSDNPLKVRITPRTAISVAKFFGKGSSKEEVLAIQGTPDRDTGNAWDYGYSRVFFEKDHVTEWHEAPLNPLKVR